MKELQKLRIPAFVTKIAARTRRVRLYETPEVLRENTVYTRHFNGCEKQIFLRDISGRTRSKLICEKLELLREIADDSRKKWFLTTI